jgi:hypothetical protein
MISIVNSLWVEWMGVNTHFTAVRGDEGGDKALQVLVVLPISGHVGE